MEAIVGVIATAVEHNLSEPALAELRRIEAAGQCETTPNPEFDVLWLERYVMGPHKKTHITSRGRRLVQQLDGKPLS